MNLKVVGALDYLYVTNLIVNWERNKASDMSTFKHVPPNYGSHTSSQSNQGSSVLLQFLELYSHTCTYPLAHGVIEEHIRDGKK